MNTIKLREMAAGFKKGPRQIDAVDTCKQLYIKLIEAADEIDRLRAIVLSDHFEKEEINVNTDKDS